MPAMPQVGLVGKPNAGKSTFFAAATLADVKIAPYPFTTVDANRGVGYVRLKCVCTELGVKDDPRNSLCIRGWRFAPIELIDVAGLVPDAWRGRGLGNRFLDELRRASALIHIVDASGSTDFEGNPVKPGSHDPLEDVEFLEREIDMWIFQILSKDWDRIAKLMDFLGADPAEELYRRLSGLGVSKEDVERALNETGLAGKRARLWTERDILTFVKAVRRLSKPMIIAANKADLEVAEDHIKNLMKELRGRYVVVPTSAEAELALRRAASRGLIDYLPGDSDFEIKANLDAKRKRALEYIRERVLKKWGSTGVQQALNAAVFEVLGYVAVFPVENENKYTDHEGRVLPDVFLLPPGSTARDLAYAIHTELGEKFAMAIDAKTKRRLPGDYRVRHRDVIKIVITSR